MNEPLDLSSPTANDPKEDIKECIKYIQEQFRDHTVPKKFTIIASPNNPQFQAVVDLLDSLNMYKYKEIDLDLLPDHETTADIRFDFPIWWDDVVEQAKWIAESETREEAAQRVKELLDMIRLDVYL